MVSSILDQPLRGIVPPLVTPLSGQDELDVSGLERLVSHVLGGGVHGLFILGSTGEGPSLSNRLKREVIERVCHLVGGRVPVLVGITDTSIIESIALADHAAQVGANGVVVAPPHYFSLDQVDLLVYFEQLISQLHLPVFLYNAPRYTKTSLTPETVERILRIGNVVGLKDSSGDMNYFHQIRQTMSARTEFTLHNGTEGLLVESILLGGHGGVCGGANLFPQLYVQAYEAAKRHDVPVANISHQAIMHVCSVLCSLVRGSNCYLMGLKCALSCAGICDDHLAQPLDKSLSYLPDRLNMEVEKLMDNIRVTLEPCLA